MDHGDGLAAGRRDHVDLGIDLRQWLFENDHGKDGRSGGDIAGSQRDGVGRRHAGACVALGRAERDPCGQKAMQIAAAGLCQRSCRLSGCQDGGQHAADRPVEAVFAGQHVKFVEHGRVIRQRPAVNGEHAGCFADADGVFTGKKIMDIARERGDMGDASDVRFPVQDGLIQVRDGPALRDVEAEGLCELVGRFAGHGVLPRAERGKQVPVLIKGQIAVHHT